MSFDDYANHIYQKHRLAITLAIIKSKPSNISTAQYLEQLKSKVDDKMDDDDITVCSDDFLLDDDDEMNDSVTILKDFDIENVRQDETLFKDCVDEINEDRNMVIDIAASAKQIDINKNQTQTTNYDSSQNQLTSKISHEIHNSADDVTFYEENQNLDNNLDIDQSINDEFNSKIKDTDHNTWNNRKTTEKNTSNTLNKPSSTEIVNTNHIPIVTSNIATDLTYFDSQETVLYTVHGFTQNYTHYSPSQSDIVIPNKYIYGTKRNTSDTNKNKEVNNVTDHNSNFNLQNVNKFSNETEHVSKKHSVQNVLADEKYENQQLNKEFEYSLTMNAFSQNNDTNYTNKSQNVVINNQNSNTNATEYHNDSIKNKEITSIDQNLTQYSQNINEYFGEMKNIDENPFSSSARSKDHGYDPLFLAMEIKNNALSTQNIDPFCFNINTANDLIVNDKNQMINDANLNQNADKTQNLPTQSLDLEQNTVNNYQLSIIADENGFSGQNIDTAEELNIVDEENASEVISYKVLEEFNRVKTFLNRQHRRMSCDGYSTDSGYRSDSQIRSSNRSALQLSGTWLNQSGCCLFNYIMQCPLVTATRDITDEIAQVLSQLIDKLHDEEKYPSFLEELLDTVDVLLLEVYEGECTEFLKKDESIQRILLLNKSFQIQRHCIDKISNILESFHTKVTETDSTFELVNIDQIENISYIFHILEILLKKYLKSKDLSQPSTQLSQDEDKIFKKSSITDIWRKKWNPNIEISEGSKEKKCVLKICSEILNKIVVDCVNSYSLVAYSAVKCFNSMQT